jgi:putative FmdB family regulatory protein
MPIYEYRRPDGTTFELQQSFSDEPLKVDPETGVPVERVLHPPAVHFKGKGFYNTDYGTRNRERETAAAEKGSAKDGSKAADAAAGASGDGKGKPGAASDAKQAAPAKPGAAKDAKPVTTDA